MILHCTRRLASRLEEVSTAQIEDTGPLASWHGHLYSIDRRQCLFFCHDATRYCLILPGVRAPQLEGLGRWHRDLFLAALASAGAETAALKRAELALGATRFDTATDRSVLSSIAAPSRLASRRPRCRRVRKFYMTTTIVLGRSRILHIYHAIANQARNLPINSSDDRGHHPHIANGGLDMLGTYLRIVTVVLALGCGNALASVIDQVSPEPHNSAINTSSVFHWQQEVVVGVGGRLAGISLFVTTTEFGGSQNDFNFGINPGPAWQTDANSFSTVVSTTIDGYLFIDTSSAALDLNVGDTFVIDITPLPSSTTYGVALQFGSGSDNYAPGRLFLDGIEYSPIGDIIFTSHMETVPEPATLALVGLGLLGLRLRLRRAG